MANKRDLFASLAVIQMPDVAQFTDRWAATSRPVNPLNNQIHVSAGLCQTCRGRASSLRLCKIRVVYCAWWKTLDVFFVFVFFLRSCVLCFRTQKNVGIKHDFFFVLVCFFLISGLCFPVEPGALDQEPKSHQCSTPAETSQALILATVVSSNTLWPSVLEGRIPQLLRSLNLTSDHVWDAKECDRTQCVRRAKWNVTVHIICGGLVWEHWKK